MVRFFNALGTPLLSFFQYLGELVLLAADTFRSIFTHKLRWKLFLNQVVEIGLLSQLVVIITGAFTGAVFSAQTFFQFNKLGMGSAVGAVVSVSLCRELAPVLTALMVAGRVGAAMSAEIGTMKVTEQIDALRALAVYPVDYLVVPRALAMMISMPLLVAECIAVGIAAGYLVAISCSTLMALTTWRTWCGGRAVVTSSWVCQKHSVSEYLSCSSVVRKA